MAEWITAIAALVAALATAAYLVVTILIFRQTTRSADAAEKSATGAQKSAAAAQRGIDLAAQQFAEHPHKVRRAQDHSKAVSILDRPSLIPPESEDCPARLGSRSDAIIQETTLPASFLRQPRGSG